MASDGGTSNIQVKEEAIDFSDNSTSQNEIEKSKKEEQNKMRCKRYRERKKETVSSQDNKGPVCTATDEELLRRRREYNKQKSKRHRDRKKFRKMLEGAKRKTQEVLFDDVIKIKLLEERRKYLNKIRCQRYRDKMKFRENNMEMFPSQVYQGPIHIVKEKELIERRREKNRQNSKRYRDRKKLKMSLEAAQKEKQDDNQGVVFFHDRTSLLNAGQIEGQDVDGAHFFHDGTSLNEFVEIKIEIGSPE